MQMKIRFILLVRHIYIFGGKSKSLHVRLCEMSRGTGGAAVVHAQFRSLFSLQEVDVSNVYIFMTLV